MSKNKYNHSATKDTYRVFNDDGIYTHSGKALYGNDGHMIRLDIFSPVLDQHDYHHRYEWWSEKDGYGHEIHKDH